MTKHKIKTIDVHELKHQMDNQANLSLIDVRELDEWEMMHIPGALHIPKDRISLEIQNQIPNKEQTIYLHYRSGVRSLYAAQCLMDLGYYEVYSVDGGIMAWAMSGYPVKQESYTPS
ncbi:Probable adenylyltransferase/sulfurtransferase MoeZ [Legionella pneumophila]|uniref:rhodanese-like domain-containing protein n=1 Tax=Legionella pneumophila TaxID=446 RepID=UPI000770B5A6|nr:rhodanese-like domain-containing protein [Legionella pneumophila]CZI82313.1 Probable adenylyltransferase/sulfurtransferase MoeZ [Legionella pneumophila]